MSRPRCCLGASAGDALCPRHFPVHLRHFKTPPSRVKTKISSVCLCPSRHRLDSRSLEQCSTRRPGVPHPGRPAQAVRGTPARTEVVRSRFAFRRSGTGPAVLRFFFVRLKHILLNVLLIMDVRGKQYWAMKEVMGSHSVRRRLKISPCRRWVPFITSVSIASRASEPRCVAGHARKAILNSLSPCGFLH